MKRFVLPLALALTGAAMAASNDQPPKLWSEMQAAVMRTQDIQKVGELLKEGADVNAPIACGTFNALDGAIGTQNLEMVRFLLAHGARPRGSELARAASECTALPSSLEIVRALLKAGADPNTPQYPQEGDTPLMLATWRGNKEVVALLLAQPGIKVDAMDSDGETALMSAAEKGDTEIVDLLLRAGANPAVKNHSGETAANVTQAAIDNLRGIIARLGAQRKPESETPLAVTGKPDQ